jgi:hypothetical protein
MTLHLSYPTVTQGHWLTGLTPVSQNQTELIGLTLVAKPNELTGLTPVDKPTKPSTRPDPNQPYPTNHVKGPCCS